MPTVILKEMTNEELIAFHNEINKILKERQDELRANAIDNFRKAFEEISAVCKEIYVLGYDDDVTIETFEDFHFVY